jgi:hypothetical protein
MQTFSVRIAESSLGILSSKAQPHCRDELRQYEDGSWEMVIGYLDENEQQELDDEGAFEPDIDEL